MSHVQANLSSGQFIPSPYEASLPTRGVSSAGIVLANNATNKVAILATSVAPAIGTSDGWMMAVFRADGYVNNGSAINALCARGSLASGTASGPAIILSNTNKIAAHIGGSSLTAPGAVSTNAVNDGKWHCAVAFRTGTTVRLVLDGILQSGTDTTALACDSSYATRLFIDGAASPGTTRYWNGACAFVAYGTGRLMISEAQILSLAPALVFAP